MFGGVHSNSYGAVESLIAVAYILIENRFPLNI